MKYGILDYQNETDIESKIITDGTITTYLCDDERLLPDSVEELDAVALWHNISLSEIGISKLKKCKAIIRIGVGYDSVDIKTAGKHGIPVINIPDYGTNDVADHTWALVLSAVRKTHRYQRFLQEDIVENWVPEIGEGIFRLTGKTYGIIGMGRIGTAVAMRAKAFGMNVVFYDPYVNDGYDKAINCKRVESIEELLSMSNIVSVHTPLTDETRHLLNDSLLSNIDNKFILVNTARGGIVENVAVYNAIEKGIILSFAADVLENEPPTVDDKLIKLYQSDELDRIIISPHSAFYAEESRIEMREKSAIQMQNAANGVPLRNCVNKEYLIDSRTKVL